MKKLLTLLLGALLILTAVVAYRTLTYPFEKNISSKADNSMSKYQAEELSLKRFSGGIQIPTISSQDPEMVNWDHFDRFKSYLQEVYPQIFSTMEYREVNGYGMVFRWKGKDASLSPILFLSHYDVVPVTGLEKPEYEGEEIFRPQDKALPPVTEIPTEWDFHPFSGAVANGRIYGRGTLDMKNMLFSLLEAADKLIGEGFTPAQDIYFAFGHDEEVGGLQGATKIAEDFADKGITFGAVFDEGGLIASKGTINDLDTNIALIGLAEKGVASLKVTVKGLGGHSSMPPLQSAIGKAAIIMQHLEENQMKAMIIPPIENFLKNIGGQMAWTSRMAIANQWLFKPVLMATFSKSPTTNALIRTTTALTMMEGSPAANVLSSEVSFVVNFRILPGNTVEEVKAHVAKACEGFDVEIEEFGSFREASKLSPSDAKPYLVMKAAIEQTFPGTIVTPYVTVGGTDAYKYERVSDHVYRFMPVVLNTSEQRTLHSENEYISIEAFGKMIAYFEQVMKTYGNK